MTQADAWERELRAVGGILGSAGRHLREQEAELAAAREQIAAHEATLSHEWTLADDIDKDLARARQRRAD